MATRAIRRRFLVLAVLCSLAFLTYLDRICIMRVQNEISADLNFGAVADSADAKAKQDIATEKMGWVFAAFAAGYLLFEVPGGWLGDKWGARRVIFRIVLCWSLFTAATGGVKGITRIFTRNAGPEEWFIALVVIRFLFGAFEAGAYPNIARALARWFPFGERAGAQSFIWFSARLGGGFAPAIIGGLMALAGTWQRAFYILGAIGMVWASFFVTWYRGEPEETKIPIAQETPFRWQSLLSPNVLALCVVSFSVSFCFFFFITFLPRYLKDQFAVDFQQSQWISGLPMFLGAFACIAGGFLSDYAIRKTGSRSWGRSLVPIIGWSIAALCVFIVPALHSAGAVMATLAIGFMFQDLGVASMWSVPADIGGRFTGTVGGWMNTAGCVAGMLSPVMSAKMSNAYGWNSMFIVFGFVYLLGVAAWLRVDASETINPHLAETTA